MCITVLDEHRVEDNERMRFDALNNAYSQSRMIRTSPPAFEGGLDFCAPTPKGQKSLKKSMPWNRFAFR